MFHWQKKRQRKKAEDKEEEEEDKDNLSSADEEDGGCEAGGDSERYEWGKMVELELRVWIGMTKCRCDVADDYFDNHIDCKRECLLCLNCSYVRLTSLLAPSYECCDNCSRRNKAQMVGDEERPVTPDIEWVVSAVQDVENQGKMA
jgi:hypothetical protein